MHQGASSGALGQITVLDILVSNSDLFPEGVLTNQQIDLVGQYIKDQQIDYTYFGVPSVNNEIPFQLAQSLEVPVLMAYEFMFKPESHCLWDYVSSLGKKSNVKWAIPLSTAKEDFQVPDDSLFVTGHLSIDNAYLPASGSTKSPQEIKEILQISQDKQLAFISSTTQPVEIDSGFLDCLLTELKKHPNIQVRLGLHPGIENLDLYLKEILTIYRKHPQIIDQFKIILPDFLERRIQTPELTINDPIYQNVFLKANITGNQAASAAHRVAQAVPGALLNQAVLEGKPTYSHLGKPYLPRKFITNTIASFFTTEPQLPPLKEELGLDKKTAPEKIAEIIMTIG